MNFGSFKKLFTERISFYMKKEKGSRTTKKPTIAKIKEAKMHTYFVKASYNMGMSSGSEVYEFIATDDATAKGHLKKLTGGWLHDSGIKRNVSFDMTTLARGVEPVFVLVNEHGL